MTTPDSTDPGAVTLDPAAQASDCTCPKRWNGHTHQCWLRVVKRLAAVVADNCALRDGEDEERDPVNGQLVSARAGCSTDPGTVTHGYARSAALSLYHTDRANHDKLRRYIDQQESALTAMTQERDDYREGAKAEAARCDELLQERTRARNETLAAREELAAMTARVEAAEADRDGLRLEVADLKNDLLDIAEGRATRARTESGEKAKATHADLQKRFAHSNEKVLYFMAQAEEARAAPRPHGIDLATYLTAEAEREGGAGDRCDWVSGYGNPCIHGRGHVGPHFVGVSAQRGEQLSRQQDGDPPHEPAPAGFAAGDPVVLTSDNRGRLPGVVELVGSRGDEAGAYYVRVSTPQGHWGEWFSRSELEPAPQPAAAPEVLPVEELRREIVEALLVPISGGRAPHWFAEELRTIADRLERGGEGKGG